MKKITILLAAIILSGCAGITIHSHRPIYKGKTYVEQFGGNTGHYLSNAIQIKLQKEHLLANNKEKADYILKGSSTYHGLQDASSVILFDKNSQIIFSANCSSGGWLCIKEISEQFAKKITKKLQKNN